LATIAMQTIPKTNCAQRFFKPACWMGAFICAAFMLLLPPDAMTHVLRREYKIF
jgi:hypothetical protein